MSAPLLITGLIILLLIVAGQYLLASRSKRIEGALREEIRQAKARADGFQTIMEHAPFEILLKDSEGRYVEVSRSWQEYYGVTNEEAARKTPQELFGDDFGDRLSARDRRALSDGRAIETEDEVPHPDGTTHLFHTTTFPIPGEDGRASGLGMISADVTKRKQTEQALRESEEQLRTITDNLPVLIVRWDRELRYRFANKFAEQWSGRPVSGIVGRTIPEVFGEKAYEQVRWAIESGLSGKVVRIEERLEYPDGVIRDVDIAYIPDRAGDGEVLGCFALVQDVTERKQLEAKLLRKERLAAMGQLTGTVAHELRNPLAAIAMSLGVIGHKASGAGLDLERALDRAARSMRRCETIITELLDFARARGLQPQPTRLDDWLAELLDEYETPAGVSLSIKLQCEDLVLAIDPDELRRAVINLLDNACDAMAPNGGGGPYDLAVTTRVEGGRLEMIFVDIGPGIPADIMPDIMEPLFSTKSFGTGLGLPTVKRIMEEHGGGVEIDSEEGKGARAVLWLPVDDRREEIAG